MYSWMTMQALLGSIRFGLNVGYTVCIVMEEALFTAYEQYFIYVAHKLQNNIFRLTTHSILLNTTCSSRI